MNDTPLSSPCRAPLSADPHQAAADVRAAAVAYVLVLDGGRQISLYTEPGSRPSGIEYVLDASDPAITTVAAALSNPLVVTWGLNGLVRLARANYEPVGGVRDVRVLSRLLSPETNQPLWYDEVAPGRAPGLAQLAARADAAVAQAGLQRPARLDERSLPLVIQMAAAGVPVDRCEVERRLAEARAEAAAARVALDAVGDGWCRGSRWRWEDDGQVLQAFRRAHAHLPDLKTETITRRLRGHWAEGLGRAFIRDRAARMHEGLLSRWLNAVEPDGRVRPVWDPVGAETGRMTCSDPAVQALPRADRGIVRAPAGRVLVAADYSQIQLRAVARITRDARMAAAFAAGRDLHAETAKILFRYSGTYMGYRDMGKEVNFTILYGGTAATLAEKLGDRVSRPEAFYDAFLAAYEGLRPWHNPLRGDTADELRTPGGRRVWSGGYLDGPRRLCRLAQGMEAEGLKAALALLWERRGEVPGAVVVLANHDEIVVECPEAMARAVAIWLAGAMSDAMASVLDPIPVGPIMPGMSATWAGSGQRVQPREPVDAELTSVRV